MKRAAFLVAGICTTIVGCAHAASRKFDVLDAHSEPLRSRFNAAKGKVRVHITVPVPNGWKAIALSSGARQELFISTALTRDALASALRAAGAEVE